MPTHKVWFYTYILKCRDGKYYVGVTSNIEERVNQHNRGDDPGAYTFRRRPVELMYYAQFTNPYDAISYEKQLKGWSRAKKQALIEENWDRIQQLAECRNASHYKNYEAPGEDTSLTSYSSGFDSAQPDDEEAGKG